MINIWKVLILQFYLQDDYTKNKILYHALLEVMSKPYLLVK